MARVTPWVTPWFDGTVKPVRVGWYPRKLSTDAYQYMNYWDGAEWHYNADESSNAPGWLPASKTMSESSSLSWQWRGLTKPAGQPARDGGRGMEHDDMALPKGRSCADCAFYRHCRAFIGEAHIHDKQTRCDWSPSRFIMVKRTADPATARQE